MNLATWAQKWNVPVEAVVDLQNTLGAYDVNPIKDKVSEASVLAQVRLEASQKRLRLWRNNVGAVHTEDKRFIRFGLANDSKRVNDVFKSSDLIGIKPVMIVEGHVGKTIGQFVARECKASAWKWKGTNREAAQLNFLTLVASMGGDAAFTTGTGTL